MMMAAQIKKSPILQKRYLGTILLEHNLIADAADIFTLKEGDLDALPRMAEKSIENLLKAIDDKKEISLSRFLIAL